MNRRLGDLEQRAGVCDTPRVKVIRRTIVAPGDVENNRPGRVAIISIVGDPGKADGMRFTRGDDEPKRAFLDRAGDGYRALHGTLPGDWYERDAA